MEERGDFQGNVNRPLLSSLRPSGSLKSTLSGKSTPRGSPSFRRLYSSRTPRRDGRGTGGHFQWIWSNRLLLWLILITLWAYLGFYVQSKWAHGDNNGGKEGFVGYRSKEITGISHMVVSNGSVINEDVVMAVNKSTSENQLDAVESKIELNLKDIIGTVMKKKKGGARSISSKKTRRSSAARKLRSKTRGKEKVVKDDDLSNNDLMEQEEEIPKRNTSYGMLVGPFGSTEDRTLEWSAEKRSGTCDRKGEFSRMVWSRKFVLVFHELSMTGAPLSMMELATEFLSCGATVSAVVLSKRGGLMGELVRRKIKVIEDKADLSFKTAMKADLVIAGSAICSTWIEQYIVHFPAGSGQIAWWLMENRREYFERAKPMLNRVKLLVFLSESQSKQWLTWCEEDGIKLNSEPALLPLSVNDELAFVAGIPCSLNTPSFSVENMMERRRLLRDAVRKEMGLTDKDMLVMSLSSINPGKGQLLLLESALLTIDHDLTVEGSGNNGSVKEGNISSITVSEERSAKDGNQHSRALFENMQIGESLNEPKRTFPISSSYNTDTAGSTHKMRKLLSENDEKAKQNQTLKVLIGSVGSKSNKVPYVKGILKFLSQHPELSKLVLWTPATTRVASLYSAADAYAINSQGLGETFGRVTIEAMAFGLPVLGTDAGGTKEIVEHNVTGLLHPLGRPGSKVLAQNLLFLLNNPSEREQMGMRGRRKVEQMYLKHDMYEKFAFILFKCMRIK